MAKALPLHRASGQPVWFRDNRDFPAIQSGLQQAGFSGDEIAGLMGGNRYRFYSQSFGAMNWQAARHEDATYRRN